MTAVTIPFNIEILYPDQKALMYIKPVRVLDIFQGSSKNFHEDGLFSQTIFGKVGDSIRNKRFSYIDIKLHIFHPLLFKAITSISPLYADIMAKKQYAEWDDSIKNFVKTDQLSGDTGYAFFIKHWKDIEWKRTGSDKRESVIQLIEKYKNVALTNKVIVLPAGLRDYEIDENGKETEDEFNSLYRSLLNNSSIVHEKLITEDSIRSYDNVRMSLQRTFNEIYSKITSMLEGKNKLILGKWTKRAVFNGTRNVITSANVPCDELFSSASVGVNDTIVGLFQYLKAILPVAKFHIKNGFLGEIFPGPSAPALLVNKKTLEAEQVRISPDHYDGWMTDEGLDNTINLFGDEANRSKVLEIEDHYMGLIYKGTIDNKKVFKLFHDIRDLPPHLDKKDVYPLKFVELLYCSIYHISRKYPALVTRYPITDFCSIYPSRVYLKPTIHSEIRYPLNENWEIAIPDESNLVTDIPAYNFPVGDIYYNALSPHPTKLAKMGADFDGDMCSFNVLYSDESLNEIESLLHSKNFYVGSDGKISFSVNVDTVKYLMKTLTGDPVNILD